MLKADDRIVTGLALIAIQSLFSFSFLIGATWRWSVSSRRHTRSMSAGSR